MYKFLSMNTELFMNIMFMSIMFMNIKSTNIYFKSHFIIKVGDCDEVQIRDGYLVIAASHYFSFRKSYIKFGFNKDQGKIASFKGPD